MDAERARQIDEEYIKRTSFEVYMVGGLVFLLAFTAVFIWSVMASMQVWLWPGSLLAIAVGYLVWDVLRRRERRNRRRECETTPSPNLRTPQE